MNRPTAKTASLLPILAVFLFVASVVFTSGTAEAGTLPTSAQANQNVNTQLAWYRGGWGYRGGWYRGNVYRGGWGYRGGYYRGGYPAYWGPRCVRNCWNGRCFTRCN